MKKPSRPCQRGLGDPVGGRREPQRLGLHHIVWDRKPATAAAGGVPAAHAGSGGGRPARVLDLPRPGRRPRRPLTAERLASLPKTTWAEAQPSALGSPTAACGTDGFAVSAPGAVTRRLGDQAPGPASADGRRRRGQQGQASREATAGLSAKLQDGNRHVPRGTEAESATPFNSRQHCDLRVRTRADAASTQTLVPKTRLRIIS